MQITWREELSVGVPLIDDQHKELIPHFNALLIACNEGRGKEEVGHAAIVRRGHLAVGEARLSVYVFR